MSASPTDQDPLLASSLDQPPFSPSLSERPSSYPSSFSVASTPPHASHSSHASTDPIQVQRRPSQISKNVYTPLGIRKLGDLGLIPMDDAAMEAKLPSPKKKTSISMSAENIPHRGSRSPSLLIPIKIPTNLGSHFFSANHLNEDQMASLTTRKKKVYSQLSLIFGLILLTFVLYDYISLLVFEKESLIRPWLMSIQMLHVAAFYLFLFGFIYSNESGDFFGLKISVLALLVNLVSFIARAFFDINYYKYLPN